MKKFLRAVLAIYLLHSAWEAALAGGSEGMIPPGQSLLVGAIAFICFVTAVAIIFSASLARWGVVVCQAPQLVGLVIPKACFYVMTGIHCTISLSYFPHAGGFKPHVDVRDGAQWCLALRNPDDLSGYAIGVNLSAIAAIACAFLVAQKPNKSAEPTPIERPFKSGGGT